MREKKKKSRNSNHNLTEQELKRFYKGIATLPKHDLMFTLALYYGLRVGEIAAIKLSDIEEQNRAITIQGIKGGRQRTYEIPTNLLKKYKLWIVERSKQKKWSTNHYLFTHRDNKNQPMTRTCIQYEFHSFCAKASIQGHSIHDLRHTCAMLQVKKGTDPIRLRNWLRQKSIQSTQVYFEEFHDKEYEKQTQKVFKDFL